MVKPQNKSSLTIEKNKDVFLIKVSKDYLKTPLGKTFYIPNKKIAKIILMELKNKKQKNTVVSYLKITNTAIDIVQNNKNKFVQDLTSKIHIDTVCYFSKTPKDLFEKQNNYWKPLLDWINNNYFLQLTVTYSFEPIIQNKEIVRVLENILMDYSIFQLSCINTLCQITGSLIVSLALENTKITHKEAFKACQLEELYQLSKWGNDSEASNRLDAISTDIYKASNYLNDLRFDDKRSYN